jgi:hypothetical protein
VVERRNGCCQGRRDEPAPDGRERHQGGGIRQGVGCERHGAPQPEEGTAQGLAQEPRPPHARLVLGERRLELGRRDEQLHRGELREVEDHREAALDERDGGDQRDRRVAGGDRGREPCQRDQPAAVACQHRAPSVDPVDEDPRRELDQQVRDGGGEADDPRLRGRARERQHEERVGHRRHSRAERRDRLADPQELEVAVPPERSRIRHRPCSPPQRA